jgi:tetratricopeptide (TPR) repeat protein
VLLSDFRFLLLRSCDHSSVSISHNLLGDLEHQSGSTEPAGKHYLAALKIREDQKARGVNDAELTRDLIVSLNKVGDYFLSIGQSQTAADHFQRSLKSSQLLDDENPEDF